MVRTLLVQVARFVSLFGLFSLLSSSCSSHSLSYSVEVESEEGDTVQWICYLVKEYPTHSETDTLRFGAKETTAKFSLSADSLLRLSLSSEDRMHAFDIPFDILPKGSICLHKTYPSLSYFYGGKQGKLWKKFVQEYRVLLIEWDRAWQQNDEAHLLSLRKSMAEAVAAWQKGWSQEEQNANRYWTARFTEGESAHDRWVPLAKEYAAMQTEAYTATDTLLWSLRQYPSGKMVYLSQEKGWDYEARWQSSSDTLVWYVWLDRERDLSDVARLPKGSRVLRAAVPVPLLLGEMASRGQLPRAIRYEWDTASLGVQVWPAE